MKLILRKFKQVSILIFLFILSIVPTRGEELLRVLAIGNSFSTDAVEAHLDDLAKAAGKRLIIGNMYIGGASLQTHWESVSGNKANYSFRKITEGDTVVYSNKSLLFGVQHEKWDIITFQQGSAHAGMYDTFFPYLTDLLNYVRTNALNSLVKFGMHQTWSYASNSALLAFTWYDKDQMKMYAATVDAVNRAAAQVGIDFIIPVGTAIQNGRSSFLGDNFNRDGNHLTEGVGRYTAACTWFEKLFNTTVVGNTCIPENVSKSEAWIAQNAAHLAVLTPNEVTSMSNYKPAPAEPLKNSVLVDFGSTLSTVPWNNLTTADGHIIELKDVKGISTGISMHVDDAFGGTNSEGPVITASVLNIAQSASSDSFWGNGAYIYTSKSERTGGLLFTNLDTTQYFDFEFFSSIISSDSKSRETYFLVTGEQEKRVTLEAANNTTEMVGVNNIKSKSDGSIHVEVGPGDNNANMFKLFYLNALRLSPSVVAGIQSTNLTQIKLYPNPAVNKVYIQSDMPVRKVDVYDLHGQIIKTYSELLNGNPIGLDIEDLYKGYYIFNIDGCTIPCVKI